MVRFSCKFPPFILLACESHLCISHQTNIINTTQFSILLQNRSTALANIIKWFPAGWICFDIVKQRYWLWLVTEIRNHETYPVQHEHGRYSLKQTFQCCCSIGYISSTHASRRLCSVLHAIHKFRRIRPCTHAHMHAIHKFRRIRRCVIV